MNRIIRDKWFLWLLDVEFKNYFVCRPVADLYRRRIAGDEPTRKEWAAVAAAADWAAVAADWASARAADAAAAVASAAVAAPDAADAVTAAVAATDAADAAAAEAAAAPDASWAARVADATDAVWKRLAKALADICAEHGYALALPDLHHRVHVAATAPGHRLNMDSWHVCETTHCRAGWTTVIHPLGMELEALVGPRLAASAIYVASGAEIPNWFADNQTALADIRRCAEGAR